MTPDTTITPDAPAGNFFSRLIGVYFSPGETFKEIGAKPGYIGPILGLMLIGALIGFMIFTKIDFTAMMSAQIDQMVEAGRVTKEQAPQMLATQIKVAKTIGAVAAVVGNIIVALIIAGIFKLVSLVLGKENSYGPLLSVTLYTFLAIGIISSLLFVTMLFLKGSDFDLQNPMATNLAAFLSFLFEKDSLPKFVWSLARSVDIFAIWMIVLLGIGYAAVSRRLKTSTATLTLGALYFGYSLVSAALGAIFGQ